MAKKPKIKVFRQSSASYCLPERAILNPVTRWHCKNLQYTKQVGVSYKRFHGLKMPVQQIERLLLQPFRVVPAAGTWITWTTDWAVTATVRRLAFQFVV